MKNKAIIVYTTCHNDIAEFPRADGDVNFRVYCGFGLDRNGAPSD